MPRILGPLPANRAERAVFRQLEQQLAADWVVLSNVGWSTRQVSASGRTWVRDGQADFVVLAPGFGLCVVEVKGSRHVRVGADGCWYRSHDGDSWEPIRPKTPPEQAITNTHEITSLASRRMGWTRFPWPFAYIVAYPWGEVLDGALNTFDPSTIVLRKQMPELATAIRAALRARGSTNAHRPFNSDSAAELGSLLMNHPLRIGPVDTSEDAASDRDAIEVLTRQQHAALRGVFLHPRVAVTGPAGSGKTVLAIWRLRALVEQGDKALFLCFNKMLAQHLRMENPDIADSIWNVDSYFRRLTKAKKPEQGADLDQYFGEELPGLVVDLVETRNSDDMIVDAVIVDEGQDFGEFRLWAARSLIRPGGTFVYFSDDQQDLYDRRVREAVGAEVIFSLVHNCRNTIRINETGNRVLDDHIQSMPGLPEGVETLIEYLPDARSMAKAAWRHAASWIGSGLRVAILSPFTLDKSSMARSRKGHNLTLVTDLTEWREMTVLFSTLRSFKGLEADAVVLVDGREPVGPPLDRRDLYVAITRARVRLAVLCADQTIVGQLGGQS